MSAFRHRLRADSGQAVVFVVVGLFALLGMAALVIDGGSWRQTQRHLQTAADAGALAGAQNLAQNMGDQAGARSVAINYAQQNYTGLSAPTVTFHGVGNEIDVSAATTAPGFLAKIFGEAFATVEVRAHARAAVTVPDMMKNVAPVAVKDTVACAATDPSCYGQTVTLTFDESNVRPSTIGLINLTCHSTVSTACGSSKGIGGNQLNDWIENGYADSLPSNQWYGVKTGQTVGPLDHAFNDRVRVPLFFPVFNTVANEGPDYFFHVIGWAAFVIDPGGVNWGSQNPQLTGHFVQYTTSDLPAGSPAGGSNDFGVHVITLTQ